MFCHGSRHGLPRYGQGKECRRLLHVDGLYAQGLARLGPCLHCARDSWRIIPLRSTSYHLMNTWWNMETVWNRKITNQIESKFVGSLLDHSIQPASESRCNRWSRNPYWWLVVGWPWHMAISWFHGTTSHPEAKSGSSSLSCVMRFQKLPCSLAWFTHVCTHTYCIYCIYYLP